jgi:CheY-like chemotaxis protein
MGASHAARRKTGAPKRRTGKYPLQRQPAVAPLVLVVDDSEDAREMYGEYLVSSGFRVDHAADGEHALLKVLAVMPSVVVMDLSMPVIDGWAATRSIKTHPKTKGIPVVAITGHVTFENLNRATEAGADAVLVKPCLPRDLLAVVRSILDL